MTEIRTEIEIAASRERVWQVLADFAAYEDWNPILRPVRGEAKAGARLRVRARLWNGFKFTFCPTVLKADSGRELCWRAHFLLPSLFSGEHSFLLEPVAERRVRFIQREVYSGLLSPLILLFIASDNRRAFEGMNQALKARAEQSSGA